MFNGLASHGIDCYLSDLADGVCTFVRVVICSEDDTVKAFNQQGELVGTGTVKGLASYGVMKDEKGVSRYHVTVFVRMACLKYVGKQPKVQVPF